MTLHGHLAAVTCVQFDDTRVISGAVDRLIKIWSLESGQVSKTTVIVISPQRACAARVTVLALCVYLLPL